MATKVTRAQFDKQVNNAMVDQALGWIQQVGGHPSVRCRRLVAASINADLCLSPLPSAA